MPDNPQAILPDMPDRSAAWIFGIGFFLFCCGIIGICWWASGRTLGLFLGPPALLAIILPQITAISGRAKILWLVWLLATIATAIIWFAALPSMGGTNARQIGLCIIVLAALNLLLVGLTDALLWSGIRPTAAAAVVTLLVLIWLTWPIWLSGHLRGHLGESVATWLVWAHPLYAMNVVLHFDLWDHYPYMYSTLSSLNQDVPYRVPPSIWPTVLIHGLPGVLILLLHPLFARHQKAKS